jgi:GNAT superfamily N-acetyltransferase
MKDLPLVSKLADKIWREHYPDIISMEQISYMLESRYSRVALEESIKHGERYFLSYVDDIAVGLASIEHLEGFCYLHKFYCEVSGHRKGIGTGFFNYLLKQIDKGVPIKLQVNRKNYKAINFYFKMGFAIETFGDFDIGGGYFMNDFVMIRNT